MAVLCTCIPSRCIQFQVLSPWSTLSGTHYLRHGTMLLGQKCLHASHRWCLISNLHKMGKEICQQLSVHPYRSYHHWNVWGNKWRIFWSIDSSLQRTATILSKTAFVIWPGCFIYCWVALMVSTGKSFIMLGMFWVLSMGMPWIFKKSQVALANDEYVTSVCLFSESS